MINLYWFLRWIPTVLIITFTSIVDPNDASGIPRKGGKNQMKTSNTITDFILAAVPTNLTATATAYNVSEKLLQLNISWIPNTVGRKASNYNIHVWSLNMTDNHCKSDPFYAFIEDPNCTNWTMSPKPMMNAVHDEMHSLSILPQCSYRIRLEANPHDGKSYIEIEYKVPDCVEGICSCRHAETLPKPEVHIKYLPHYTLNITWSITDFLNTSAFVLRVGPKLLDGTHSAMYNLSWSKILPASSQLSYYGLYTGRDAGKYAATVRVMDSKGCLGPEQQRVFTIENYSQKGPEMFTNNEIFRMTLLLMGIFLLVLCLLVKLLRKKCFFWFENTKQNTWIFSQGVFYRGLNLKSDRVFRRSNSFQEWNVIYVEKEIEEAKTRGEVDCFEISYNRLTIQREIGSGAFGQVFLAKAEAIRGVPGSRLVAVKKLKAKVGNEEKEEFLEEIAMLKRVGQHSNIVSLLACCTLKSDICMVMEFVPCGDLLKYLRNLRQKLDARKPSLTSMSDTMYCTSSTAMTNLSYSAPQPEECSQLDYVLDHRELQNFALQIAKGMAHLESKSITHRDLAARNILIDTNKVLKISDFGLSRRGVYVNTRRRKVPLRWLSIEAMRDSLYSSKSDVWAFAIVLWEIGTLGGFPYPTVVDYDLLHYLTKGNRLERPEIVSQNLYSIMLVCWSEMPDDRPSFAELVSHLEPSSDRRVYVEFSPNPQLPPIAAYVSMKDLSQPCK